jgi:hypothetical protein
MDTSSSVVLTSTQTVVTSSDSAAAQTGLQISINTPTPGSTLAPQNMYADNGLRFDYLFHIQPDSLQVQVTQVQTPLQYLSGLLGALAGLLGALTIVMMGAEYGENVFVLWWRGAEQPVTKRTADQQLRRLRDMYATHTSLRHSAITPP